MKPAFSIGRHSVANMKRLFFDQKAVRGAVDKATRWVFTRFGAKVRGRAMASIKPPPAGEVTVRLAVPGHGTPVTFTAPRSAAEGQPPHGESKSPLRRFIWFAYDPSARSVMIGPARLTRTRAQRASIAPQALEYGGQSVHTSVRFYRTGPRGGVHRLKANVKVNIRPHPFMRPAFDKTQEKDLAGLWRNSVKA